MKKKKENEKIMDVNDFMDVLELRSDLLYADEEDLEKAFSDDEKFIELIKVVYNLVDIDNCGFATLDNEITKSIYKLINIRRHEIKNISPETFRLINDIINKLNEVYFKPEEEKDILRINYLINQANIRKISFGNLGDIIDSMGVDGIVLDYINGEDEIEEDIPNELIVGSIVYLNSSIPELFELDEVKERIKPLIDKIDKSKTVSQKKVDNVKKKVLKI